MGRPPTATTFLAQYPEQSLTSTEDLLNIPLIGARTPLLPTASVNHVAAGDSILALQNTPFAGRPLSSRADSILPVMSGMVHGYCSGCRVVTVQDGA